MTAGSLRSVPRGRGREEGASLVEFGIVAPLLFLLLFGVIEFGYAFTQYLDVRHGAREGARLAAVNYRSSSAVTGPTQTGEIITLTCSRMDDSSTPDVTLSAPSGTAIGDEARVEVSMPLDTLTGFLDPFLGGITLASDVDIRLEQEATWDNGTDTC